MLFSNRVNWLNGPIRKKEDHEVGQLQSISLPIRGFGSALANLFWICMGCLRQIWFVSY